MKKNDYLLLTAIAAYSFLFYQQNAGINFLLFTIIFIGILIIKNKNLVFQKKWCWSAALCLISASCVFIHSSGLSILANIFSLIVVAALSVNIVTSSIFSFLFSCFSVASSMVYIILDTVARLQPKSEAQQTTKNGMKFFATSCVIIVTILFFIMYQSANPLFAENTKWINFDFISIQWIFFTLGGTIIMYGLFYNRTIKPIENWENQLLVSSKLYVNDTNIKRYETERFAGMLLFVMLNLMLLLLNIGDIQTLYFNGGLPKNISHSDFVHNGVGVIILSISIASSLIMFLFRKQFSIVKNNKALTVGIYLWIAQNILMLSSTALRNQIYIQDFNFTYKRIGVYVWLFLSVVGLMITFYTIYKNRSNWFLIRTNFAVWFTCLSFSSCVNWDKLITNYNIYNKPLAQVDFHYLFSLSDTNIPELIAITKRKDFKTIDSKLKNYTSTFDRNYYYPITYSELLREKVKSYLKEKNTDWKSFDLREQEINNSIYNFKK